MKYLYLLALVSQLITIFWSVDKIPQFPYDAIFSDGFFLSAHGLLLQHQCSVAVLLNASLKIIQRMEYHDVLNHRVAQTSHAPVAFQERARRQNPQEKAAGNLDGVASPKFCFCLFQKCIHALLVIGVKREDKRSSRIFSSL